MKTCPKCGKHFEDTTTLCPADGEVLRKTEDELIGKVLAGKYRIDEKIDEGGMGCVYRATHILMEKRVAIKVLHPSLAADDKIVARFTREAKAASRISHPHALTVTDFGEDEGGVVFLVMEYLGGRTLKDIIRAEGPMPLARATEIIRQVCGALEAAHSEGVVHRDLKSDNIMLEEASGGDWAKVLDFGIAKIQEAEGVQDPGLTAPNLIIGTPQYMSPEQCSQASLIDSRSDLYSLGVILFEMLTGHVPFTGESPTAIMMRHLQDAPPSVLEERGDLPAGVARVVARSLAKRPEDRYQTATELAEALALVASDEEAVAAAAAAASSAEKRGAKVDTNRIVVPTAPNDPARTTDNTEYEEATVVSGEMRRPRTGATEEVSEAVAPPPSPGFNPWRIMVPALALLAIVFAVFFAMRGQSSSGEEGPPLTTDPNSQPVQSVAPPTGEGERNVTTGAATPTPGAAGEAVPNAPDIGTFNPQMQPAPSPVGDENANVLDATEDGGEEADSGNANANANARPARKVDTLANSNADERGTSPQPANSNANKGEDEEEPPPPIMPKPKPKQDKPAEPKATPKPADGEPGPLVSPF